MDLRPGGGELGVATERRPAGEREEEHAAERVDVGATVERPALDLLGRRVGGGAEHRAAGAREPVDRLLPAREAEVAQVGVRRLWRAGDQHVGGLDVAVDEPARMGGVERSGDLAQQLRRRGRRQRAALDHQLAQVRAVDPAHRDEEALVLLARLVDGDHVRMLERGGHARLAHEARAELRIARQLGRDQLEGHRALETLLHGPVDDSHATSAGDGLDAVAGEEPAGGDGHRSWL